VGGYTQRVQTAWPHPDSVDKALVGTGWPLFGINGLRNKRSHLVGPLFPAFRAHFSATPGWYSSGALTESLLSGGCG